MYKHASRPVGPAVTLAVVVLLASVAGTSGQQADLPDRELSDPNAWTLLAGGDDVLALSEVPDGGLWAGTEGGGLLRWSADGGVFTQLAPPMGLPPIGSRILDLAVAPDGAVWLAGSLGAARWDGQTWTAFSVADGLPQGPIVAMALEPDGTAWAGSARHGLARLQPGAGRWTTIALSAYLPDGIDRPTGPGSAAVSDLAIDPAGRLWVAHGTGNGGSRPALSMLDTGTGVWKHIAPVGSGRAMMGPSTDQIVALAVDRDSGDLWMATWGRGAIVRRATTGIWKASVPEACGKYLRTVALIDGAAWVSCGNAIRGTGVARSEGDEGDEGGDWQIWLQTGSGPTLGSVSSIAAAGDLLWLGLNGAPGQGGYLLTDRLAPDPATARLVSSAPALPAANAITALLEDSTGALWAGTRGAGLLRRDPVTGAWDHYTRSATGGRLPGDTVTDLALRGDHLWVACTKSLYQGRAYVDGGVGRLNLSTGDWQAPIRPSSGGLPDGDVSSLAFDDEGRLWVGIGAGSGGPAPGDTVFSGDGVAALDPETGAWQRFDHGIANPGLTGGTVTDLATLPGGRLWVATAYDSYNSTGRSVGGGISRRSDGRWTGWKVRVAGLFGWSGSGQGAGSYDLVSGDFRSVYADPNSGEVLAGTWAVDPEHPETVVDRWPRVDGVINRWDGAVWSYQILPGAGWVAAIASSDQGRQWAGTTRGYALQDIGAVHGLTPEDDVLGLWAGGAGRPWDSVDLSGMGMDVPSVTALYGDGVSGRLWVGTESGGILRFEPRAGADGPQSTAVLPPTEEPTSQPTATSPTVEPTPTMPPTVEPTSTEAPTVEPTTTAALPTVEPTSTEAPTLEPTPTEPSSPPAPTQQPTAALPSPAAPQPSATDAAPARAVYRCYLPRLEYRKRRR